MENLLEKCKDNHRYYINEFCKKTNLKFLEINLSGENGFFEPMYFFSDKEGYTIKGIKSTLGETLVQKVECREKIEKHFEKGKYTEEPLENIVENIFKLCNQQKITFKASKNYWDENKKPRVKYCFSDNKEYTIDAIKKLVKDLE